MEKLLDHRKFFKKYLENILIDLRLFAAAPISTGHPCPQNKL